MDGKQCSNCKEFKTWDKFYNKTNSKDSHRSSCKTCDSMWSKKWKAENKERDTKRNKEWKLSHPNFSKEYYKKRTKLGICVTCGKSTDRKHTKCRPCLDNHNASKNGKYQKIKNLVFDHYGRICNCCGESESKFLTIDHINNDGAKHRKEINRLNIYWWLTSHKFPVGFQTLCGNCQLGKRVNNGVCPHKEN